MDSITRKRMRSWAKMVIGDQEVERFYSLPFDDIGFGYDMYGGERESALVAYAIGLTLYRNYFRVESKGIENVPSKGRAILAANRAGLAPFRSLMTFVDMITNNPTPRVLRIPTNTTLAGLPYLGLIFQRVGQIVGTKENMEVALKHEEVLLTYPERRDKLIKSFLKKKYTSTFLSPFIELCLRMRAPIVPVGLYNSELPIPFLHNVKSIVSKLNLHLLPIKLNFSLFGLLRALPLPTKFHIRYGAPINFYEEYPPETTEHPNLIRQMADVVQERVKAMIS
jgi:1-acyl-sn-glycerol-3-phosphate acyltransferase